MISQGEGCSDDNSDGPKVLQSNHPSSGKALLYQQYLEFKQNDTTMNVPDDNVVKDVIPPGGGGFQYKSAGPTVLPSNTPSCEKTLLYQQYLEKGKSEKYMTDNVVKDVIPPGGGGFQYKIVGPTVLPSNTPLCGKTLLY